MAQDETHFRNAKRIRAFRTFDRESEVVRRMANLSVLLSGAEIRRALRQTRRAARAGERGYDPARHAALLRLAAGGAGGDRPWPPAAGAAGE